MAETNLTKNKNGYGYKYTDLAQIHEYLEQNNMRYYQYVEPIDGKNYIMTVPIIDGKEQAPRRGVQIVDAILNGIKNPAQEQGSATTYARRYSLLMAFGLATEDDDGASLTGNKKKQDSEKITEENMHELVTEQQSKTIYSIMVKKGLDVEKELFNNYKIKNTKELTKYQYVNIYNAIKDMPDKK